MAIYNCKHAGDQYQITKFNRDGEIESSYLCDHVACQCPARQQPSCRHRQMLSTFLTEGLVNSNLFLDWDNGRRIVDFKGQPATVQSNEIIEPDLASQAHTDTCTDTSTPAFTQEQLYNRAVMNAGGSITTNYMQDGSVETYVTLPHEPVAPAAGVTSGEPAKPANGWRRW